MADLSKKTALLMVSLAISFLFVELAVRLVIDDGMQYDLEMWKYARAAKQISAIEGVGHEHQPNVSVRLMGVEVRINTAKLRNSENVNS
jgi:hypothetical protein